MTDIRMSQMASGIPYGDNAGRPLNPEIGRIYSNGEERRLELYTEGGWQNVVAETPSVISIDGVYLESLTQNEITIIGTTFTAGAIASAIGTNGVEVNAGTTNVISAVEINAIFSNLSAEHEPYDIKVTNPSNLYGILNESLYINSSPVWSTPSGSLGSFLENSSVSATVSATESEGATLVYSSTNLPAWLSVNQSSGVISGTTPSINAPTTYTFDIKVSDGFNLVSRQFSVSVSDTGPVWSTSQTLTPFTKNSAYSVTLVATDDSGMSPTYSIVAGSLPIGLSLTLPGLISGTPTSSSPATFTVRATDNGGTYTDRQFTIPNVGPVWGTQNTFNYYQDSTATYQLSATDDADLTVSYSIVSGLPSGFSVNSSTGLISGSSSISGNSTFTARATDSNGSYTDKIINYSGKASNTWYTLSTLSFDTSEGYGGFYDDKMWFGGGVNTVGHPTTLYYVDTLTGSVTLKNSSAILRDEVGSAWGNNGKLYIFYGAVNNSGQNRNTWEYDPVANTFTQKADSPGAASYRSDVGASSTYLYHLNDSNEFYRYDPSANTHTAMSSASGPGFPGGYAYKLGLDNGNFYCVSGNVLGRYSISGNTWTTLTAPPVSVSSYTGGSGSHSITSGAFYIFAFDDPSANSYRYSAGSNTWASLGSSSFLQTRNSFTDFDKTNGIAYVVGGTITGGYLRDIKYAALR